MKRIGTARVTADIKINKYESFRIEKAVQGRKSMMNNATNYPIKVLAVDAYSVVTQGIVSFLLADKQMFSVNVACNAKDSLRTV